MLGSGVMRRASERISTFVLLLLLLLLLAVLLLRMVLLPVILLPVPVMFDDMSS